MRCTRRGQTGREARASAGATTVGRKFETHVHGEQRVADDEHHRRAASRDPVPRHPLDGSAVWGAEVEVVVRLLRAGIGGVSRDVGAEFDVADVVKIESPVSVRVRAGDPVQKFAGRCEADAADERRAYTLYLLPDRAGRLQHATTTTIVRRETRSGGRARGGGKKESEKRAAPPLALPYFVARTLLRGNFYYQPAGASYT